MMKIDHTITISSIQVHSSYSRGAYIEYCYYKIGNQDYHKLIGDLSWDEEDKACFTSWRELPFCQPSCPLTVPCEPWENFTLQFDIWRDEFGSDTRLAENFWVRFGPSSSKTEARYDGLFNGNVDMIINFRYNYKTFYQIWEECD